MAAPHPAEEEAADDAGALSAGRASERSTVVHSDSHVSQCGGGPHVRPDASGPGVGAGGVGAVASVVSVGPGAGAGGAGAVAEIADPGVERRCGAGASGTGLGALGVGGGVSFHPARGPAHGSPRSGGWSTNGGSADGANGAGVVKGVGCVKGVADVEAAGDAGGGAGAECVVAARRMAATCEASPSAFESISMAPSAAERSSVGADMTKVPPGACTG